MAQAPTKYDRYLSDFQALEKSQAAGNPEWVSRVRRNAIDSFSQSGFPTARRGNERWKYTSVVPIANATFEYPFDLGPAGVNAADVRRLGPWAESWTNLVFIDGHYCESLSSAPAESDRPIVTSLRKAINEDGDLAERHLGQYATIEEDAFVALNTAFLRDGALVQIPEGTSIRKPLHLLYITTDRPHPTLSYPRTLVVAGKGSRATVIESYVGPPSSRYFTNAVSEIVVEDGAEVDHYRLLQDGAEAFHVGTTRVHQGRDSALSSACFARGAALARNDFMVLLDAPGSSCTLNGLYMTAESQHIDNYINIDHAKPHTTSRLYYRGILDGKSRAVFGGTVLVRRDAQKADARQSDKNLILSKDAEVDSKPSLLIYADDVKCGHGATAGHIDDDSLFYMRSRGLDQATASGLLVRGFASEVIEEVKLGELRVYLERSLLGELPYSGNGATP